MTQTVKFRHNGEWFSLPGVSSGSSEQAFAWVCWNAKTNEVGNSYNVSELTDKGVGNFDIVFSEPSDSTDYSAFIQADQSTTTTDATACVSGVVPADSYLQDKVTARFYFLENTSKIGDPEKASLLVFK